ncbi:MAG TPA: hypothetical protein VEV41_07365 [Terriglobales bacterium]|nr:hypothetical protein [Terriglobales bacterium]
MHRRLLDLPPLIQQRQSYPRLKVEHKIEHWKISKDQTLLSVGTKHRLGWNGLTYYDLEKPVQASSESKKR